MSLQSCCRIPSELIFYKARLPRAPAIGVHVRRRLASPVASRNKWKTLDRYVALQTEDASVRVFTPAPVTPDGGHNARCLLPLASAAAARLRDGATYRELAMTTYVTSQHPAGRAPLLL